MTKQYLIFGFRTRINLNITTAKQVATELDFQKITRHEIYIQIKTSDHRTNSNN